MAMAKRSIDRRVGRTRAALHHALISLILKKDYEAITIEEICDAANVGRSTFYGHYNSKDDLHRSGIENLRRVLVEHRPHAPERPDSSEQRGFNFSQILFRHAYDHKELFRALGGRRGGAVALAAIGQILSEVVHNELAAADGKKSPEDAPRELVVQYVTGACMAVLTWWLDGGAKLPPERIGAIFQRLSTKGVLPTHS